MALWRTTALLPSPFSSTSTAATGCGWRRLISDGSGQTQDLAKAAEATDAAAYAAKAAAAYADAARKTAADAARKAAADAYEAKMVAVDADPANKEGFVRPDEMPSLLLQGRRWLKAAASPQPH